MTKYIKTLIAILIMTFLLPHPVMAASGKYYDDNRMWDEYVVPGARQKPRLVDNADLLFSGEEKDINQKLDELSEKYSCNVAILTMDSHSGPIRDFADDYFDYNGFGADYNDSGILFMLSMADREWAISTKGDAIAAFTDFGQEKMMDSMLGYLGEDDYSAAFKDYISTCDRYLELYQLGTPYDVETQYVNTPEEKHRNILISIVIGLITGTIPIFVMKAQLNTVKMQTSAAGYQSGGVKLTTKQDSFVNKTLTKTPIPKDTGSRSGGGGSSVHHSSSGASHGGSHGHF
ncbi:MAG: TPM domain-containing protein [Butyrivibrio sp.]|nr:TPM domain-containing protein [Butyrivibrio sp.]